MDIEKIKKQFASEGLAHVYEWTDKPDEIYKEHAHKGRVSFYITEGSITMNVGGTQTNVQAGERFDVPVGVLHTAKVGSDGCAFIVGEEIEGDS